MEGVEVKAGIDPLSIAPHNPLKKSTLASVQLWDLQGGKILLIFTIFIEEAPLNPKLWLLPGHVNFLCQRTRGEKRDHCPEEGIYPARRGR